MDDLIPSLAGHMVWADSALLQSVAEQEGAFDDADIRKWLHHTAAAQRLFLSLLRGQPFDAARERQPPATMAELEQRFAATHADSIAYAESMDEAEMARTIDFPPLGPMKAFQVSARDALTQLIMHSEHHRAQVAARLRALGGKPPTTDYILWVRDVKGKS